MEYLLYFRSLWHSSTVLFYTARFSSALGKVFAPLFLVAGLFFLISSLKNRGERLGMMAGSLLLVYAALDFYWNVNVGLIQSRSIATAFYFGQHLVGGATIAVLFFMGEPRSIRFLPGVSFLLIVAFNLSALGYGYLRHISLGVRLYSLVNAALIGLTVVSALFYWLDQRRLLMKFIPADARIADLEKKACEWEESAKHESGPTAIRLQYGVTVCRDQIAALKTGKWAS